MAETESNFPDQITLNGIDVFLLQLDAMMLKSSAYGNVCTLLLELSKPISETELNDFVMQQSGYRWLKQLRLNQKGLFKLPGWKHDGQVEIDKIKTYTWDGFGDLPYQSFQQQIELQNESPFNLLLVKSCNSSACYLIASWHHAFMDAHGGEILVQAIGINRADTTLNWQSEWETDLALLPKAKIAQTMKKFVYEISALPLFNLYKKSTDPIRLSYKTIQFSRQQMEIIQAQAQQAGGGLLNSAYFLAVTSYALNLIRVRRGKQCQGDVLVPVPQDRRLRGAKGPVLGNQVTFLFYRIPMHVLEDKAACTQEIIRQMTELMRSNKPQDYLYMMEFLRRIPGSLYRILMKQPTSGLMGSFFYSDTGASLDELDSFSGIKINQVMHFPPNVYPPGLTFVFSRRQRSLQISIAYMQHLVSEEELETLASLLTSGLLGETASDSV